MSFEELLDRAKDNDSEAILELFETYRPLLVTYSMLDGRFDPDTWQQQCQQFLVAIKRFDKKRIDTEKQSYHCRTPTAGNREKEPLPF